MSRNANGASGNPAALSLRVEESSQIPDANATSDTWVTNIEMTLESRVGWVRNIRRAMRIRLTLDGLVQGF